MVELFVHAMWASYGKLSLAQNSAIYTNALIGKAKENSYILSSPPGRYGVDRDEDLKSRMAHFTQIWTEYTSKIEEGIEVDRMHYGLLPESEIETLEYLSSQDTMNIHGMFYGICTSHIVAQLIHYSVEKEYWGLFDFQARGIDGNLVSEIPGGWSFGVTATYPHKLLQSLDSFTLELTRDSEIFLLEKPSLMQRLFLSILTPQSVKKKLFPCLKW